MRITTRLCMSLDGYLTTAAGLPAQLTDPAFWLIVMPRLLGAGMQLTPALDAGTRLELNHQQALRNGAVEIVYDIA